MGEWVFKKFLLNGGVFFLTLNEQGRLSNQLVCRYDELNIYVLFSSLTIIFNSIEKEN